LDLKILIGANCLAYFELTTVTMEEEKSFFTFSTGGRRRRRERKRRLKICWFFKNFFLELNGIEIESF
jgi:hypothetical protein